MLKIIPLIAAALLALSVPLIAQDAGTVLRVIEAEDQIVEIRAKTRHTTVIVLPEDETILDFVVGDSEYWHLTGAANVAFLKPVATGVETNVALICASGTIYSLLATEDSASAPHLVVRIEAPPGEPNASMAAVPHTPAFVARSDVNAFQAMAQTAQETARAAQTAADAQAVAAEARAEAAVQAYQADYPTRLRFAYTLSDRAAEAPFRVEGMWHDGQFTYLRARAQESPALYEAQDGDPSLVAYDLTEDGLYIVRRVLGSGWLQIGERRATWRRNPEDR